VSEQELLDFMGDHSRRTITGQDYTAIIHVMDAETMAVRIIHNGDVVRWSPFYSHAECASVLAWAESGVGWKEDEVSE